ncbi:MAG: flagellar regulator YcgR PilZN domain-containing protein [Pseudomonadota bacterium]
MAIQTPGARRDAEHETSQIIKLTILRRLQEMRTLLKISLHGTDQHYTSTLLSTDQAAGFIVLDEFFPEAPAGVLDVNAMLRISAQYNGASIDFNTRVLEVAATEGAMSYRASIPDSIGYHQNRSDYRVKLPYSYKIQVEIYSRKCGLLSGHLDDISISGLSIAFDDRSVMKLTEGDLLDECNIYLPDQHLELPVEVRQLRMHPTRKHFVLHGKFARLTPGQEKLLGRELAKLQRELLRNYKHRQAGMARAQL